MNDTQPTISFITSVMNGARTIGRLLESLAVQSCRNFEHVVIDGGSTDGTVDILRDYEHSIAYWETEPDRGIYHAWNKALEHTAGEWICFLGADDYLWEPGTLDLVVPILDEEKERFSVIYGITNVVDSDGSFRRALGRPWEQARRDFFWNMSFPNPSTFYDQELFTAYGNFDESLKIVGDYEFSLRVLKERDALFVDTVITGMEEGGHSGSRSYAVATVKEVVIALRMHGFTKIPVWLSPRVFRVRVHTLLVRIFGEERALKIVNSYRKLTGKPMLP
jgi:glycosyltransferase involved in cell wall biosynthesis